MGLRTAKRPLRHGHRRAIAAIAMLALPICVDSGSSVSAAPSQRLAAKRAAVTAPEVGNVAPAVGPPSGGTAVVIGGSNFAGTTAVDFGSTPASFIVKTAGRIEAIAPPGAEGTVDVTVTSPEGTSAVGRSDHYSYVPPGPAVVEVTPAEGSVEGGRTVQILGAHFEGAMAVSFGGSNASFQVVSSEHISVTTPPGPAPDVDVRVTTPEGTSPISSRDRYHYTSKFIEISKVSPNKGPAAGSTVVAITGEEFHGVTDVMFGSQSATSFTANPNGVSITAVAPPQTAEQVAISVVTTFGTSEPEYCARNKPSRRKCAVRDRYKFQEPEITSLAPSTGPRIGGTSVTIAGSGFGISSGETEFLFGKSPATSVECSSSAGCTATAPASSKAGTALLKVTVHSNEPRSSKKSKAIGFTYE
jgi:hypothetical protein